MKPNPYIAGNPVGGGNAFIGRADVLREVVRVLRNPHQNAIVLFGQRRIGKTSILQHLTAWLPQEGPYHPVLFDLQDKATWPLGRVLQELAQTIAHSLGQPNPNLGTDPEAAFRDEWLPAILNSLPNSASLVLLLDEFDVLADPKSEQAAAAFFPYLRGLIASDPQRLDFVFVIGRNVADLANIALSLFKSIPHQRVSLLSREDTIELVRLAEVNRSLRWSDDAVEKIWCLTNGHPFLAQQLCYLVWAQAYDDEPEDMPLVTSTEVEAVIPSVLEASRNALEWLWNGLPPAERVVASALAEAGPGPISQESLERLLRDSGVVVIIRELQDAPQLLQEWDLIEPAEGGYRFRVELLRRWIAERKPLNQVQKELIETEPVAKNFYEAGKGLYQSGNLEQAIEPLRQAIRLNPNLWQANELLADILLALDKVSEAQQLLESLYPYHPTAARPRLVQALLRWAQKVEEEEQLRLYEQVLELERKQPEAIKGKQQIWTRRGDAAMTVGNLEEALFAYRHANLPEKIDQIEVELRRRRLEAGRQEVDSLTRIGNYQAALDLARELHADYAEVQDSLPDLNLLEFKVHLDDLYKRGVEALREGDRPTAQKLLIQVVNLEANYQEVTRYLYQAVTGIDVTKIKIQLENEKQARRNVETTMQEEAKIRQEQEMDLVKVQALLDSEKQARQKAEATLQEESKAHQKLERDLTKVQVQLESEKQTRQKTEATLQVETRSRQQLERDLRFERELRNNRQESKSQPLKFSSSTRVYSNSEKNSASSFNTWFVSALTWLPLFLPILALGLETLPRAIDAWSTTIYLWLSGGIILAWFLTGAFGDTGDSEETNFGVGLLSFIVAAVVLFSIASSLGHDLVSDASGVFAFIIISILVGILSFTVAIRTAVSVDGNVAISVAVGVAIGVASAAVFSAAVVIMPGYSWAIGAAIVGGILTAGFIVLIIDRFKRNLSSKRSWLSGCILQALLLIYVFIAWYAFLGGWRLFT